MNVVADKQLDDIIENTEKVIAWQSNDLNNGKETSELLEIIGNSMIAGIGRTNNGVNFYLADTDNKTFYELENQRNEKGVIVPILYKIKLPDTN